MIYEITVMGALDSGWSDWFQDLEISTKTLDYGMTLTTLIGPVNDQSALRGILNKLWDLNLTLVSVKSEQPGKGKDG